MGGRGRRLLRRLRRLTAAHREQALTGLSALTLLALVLLSPPERSARDWSSSAWSPLPIRLGYDGADTQPDHHQATALHERHGVDLLAAAGTVAVDECEVRAPDAARVDDLLAVLDEELARYPDGLLSHAGLQSVALGRSISSSRGPHDGVTFAGGHLLFDVESPAPRRVIHHEIWHQLERGGSLDLSGWEALNPASFAYDEVNWEQAPWPQACFVRRYATSKATDDRAEVFAAVMDGRSLAPCLRAKAHRLARALAAFDPRLPPELAAYLAPGP